MKKHSQSTITILGDGGWGTTLTIMLNRLGHKVRWWSAMPDYAKILDKKRRNPRYLPGIAIPKNIPIFTDISEAIEPSDLVILAIPSQYFRSVISKISKKEIKGKTVLSVTKGFERKTLKRMSQIVADELGNVEIAVMSGPNVAPEIAKGKPAYSVIASKNNKLAVRLQKLFLSKQFRPYTSTDVSGVEIGGALKNPIAIAAGIGDGLGLGPNAKAGVVTRGIVEMSRLGTAMGAKRDTFWGLSGLGDLVTTCLSGRNRWLGEELGRGRKLKAVLSSTPMVIEGVETARAAVALARKHKIEIPIIEQVYAVLFRGRSPNTSLRALMSRQGKPESTWRTGS